MLNFSLTASETLAPLLWPQVGTISGRPGRVHANDKRRDEPQQPNWRGHRRQPVYPTDPIPTTRQRWARRESVYPTDRTPTTQPTWAQTWACVTRWPATSTCCRGVWIPTHMTKAMVSILSTELANYKGDVWASSAQQIN